MNGLSNTTLRVMRYILGVYLDHIILKLQMYTYGNVGRFYAK